jgi:hypothetical protein
MNDSPLPDHVYRSLKNETPKFWAPRYQQWASLEELVYLKQRSQPTKEN